MQGIDQGAVERYLSLAPLEMREAVSALSNDKRWAVFIALVTEGEKCFTELKEEFGTNPNTMATILKALVEGGLVARRVQVREVGDNRKIFYEPTPVGTKILSMLYDAVLPPVRAPRQADESRSEVARECSIVMEMQETGGRCCVPIKDEEHRPVYANSAYRERAIKEERIRSHASKVELQISGLSRDKRVREIARAHDDARRVCAPVGPADQAHQEPQGGKERIKREPRYWLRGGLKKKRARW